MNESVLVLNSFVKGWNVLKWLAADHFTVNAGDFRPQAPGLFSNRIADRSKNLIYPNPKVDENAFTDSVLDHIHRHKFDIVLPVNAAEMMALARVKNEVEKYARFPFENYWKLLLLHDKKYFYELVSGLFDDTLMPRSWSIGDSTPAAREIAAKAGLDNLPFEVMPDYPTADHFLNGNLGIVFPLIVKTRRATSAVGVHRAHHRDELVNVCDLLGREDIIVQETLVGRGVGISFIRWQDPDMLHFFGHKRVREYPIAGGASTSREPWPCQNEPIKDTLIRLLDRLHWRGVVMFEFKEISDGPTRSYKILESNPRFWGSVPLAMINGINFPALLCRAVLGRDLPPVTNRNTIRARIFFSDSLSFFLHLLHGKRVWWNLKDFFNWRRLYLDDIDLSDWPATRKILRAMVAEFFGRRGR